MKSSNSKINRILLAVGIALVVAVVATIFLMNNLYRNRSQNSIPILAYHRICSDKYFDSINTEKDLWTRESDFKEEMKWLHDNGYRTLSLDEFYDWYTGDGETPEKCVVITFDDGQYNVIKYGLPILKKYDMKATMFVIGDATMEKSDTVSDIGYVGLDTMKKVQEEYPNFDFQSHSYALHYNSNADAVIYKKTEKQLQIDVSKQDERFEDYNMQFVAYPYGYYSNEYINANKNAGYKMGFLYGDQRNATRLDKPFLIPRIGIVGDETLDKAFYRWFETDKDNQWQD